MFDLANLLGPCGAFTETLFSPSGREVLRAEFPDQYTLEMAFLELIDHPAMEGHSSKAIGNVLLVWSRQ